jgi:UDP-N-acetylglucosamine 2-epimerase (non-hydrolysing)
MKIAFIIGTRPDIIKTMPLIKECQKRKIDFVLIRSFQHKDDDMFNDFIKELGIPKVKYIYTGEFDLYNCPSYIYKCLKKEKPDYFIVGGDTDTALVGAFAGMNVDTKIIHRESGIRSFDRRMHEEKNRIFISKIAHIRFAPTELNRINLENEYITENVFVTGNTIADALKIFDLSDVKNKGTALLTFHRKENIGQYKVCRNLINNLQGLDMTVYYPIHPNTKKIFDNYGLSFSGNFALHNPYTYKQTLIKIKESSIVYTDSGGIQEECSILGVPCVVLRRTTDRPELLQLGASYLIDPEKDMWEKPKFTENYEHPYGRSVAKKMVDILEGDYGKIK